MHIAPMIREAGSVTWLWDWWPPILTPD